MNVVEEHTVNFTTNERYWAHSSKPIWRSRNTLSETLEQFRSTDFQVANNKQTMRCVCVNSILYQATAPDAAAANVDRPFACNSDASSSTHRTRFAMRSE